MDAREYLNQLNTLRISIKICEDTIKKLEMDIRCAPAINYDKVDVKTSPVNKMEETIIKIEEKSKEWSLLKEVYLTKQNEILAQIMGLENPNHIVILNEHYNKGYQIRTIADHLHYTVRHVGRLHRDALKEFTKKYLT